MKNLLILLMAGAAGFVIVRLGLDPFAWLGVRRNLSGLSALGTVAFVVAALLLIAVVLAVHELGHILVGKLARFDFKSIVVGPIRCETSGGRLHFRLNRSLALAGGLVVMIPREGAYLRVRMATMTAGGPAASLLLGLVLAVWLALGDPDGNATARYLGGIAAVASTAIGFVTLVPGRAGGFSTDGGRILTLLRGGEEADREVALLSLVAAGQAGMRPADLDPALIGVVRTGPAGATRVMGDLLGYAHHLDRGEVNAAGIALERALDDAGTLPSAVAPAVALEAAYFAAAHQHDAPRGRSLLENAGKGALISSETPLRAKAAVLLAEGRGAEARPIIESALRAVTSEADASARDMARRQLMALAEAAAEPAAPAPVELPRV